MTEKLNVLVRPYNPSEQRKVNLKDLPKPEEEKWDSIEKEVERLIDEAPKDAPVRLSAIRKHIAIRYRRNVTPAMIRNRLFEKGDWVRYQRTFVPVAVIEQIEREAVGIYRKSKDRNKCLRKLIDLIKKCSDIYDIYRKRTDKYKFAESIDAICADAILGAGFII